MKNPEISIVIPLYNESKVFPLLVERLKKLLLESDYSIEIVMVDDGSNDDTAILIVDCCKKDTRFQGVLLSRN